MKESKVLEEMLEAYRFYWGRNANKTLLTKANKMLRVAREKEEIEKG